VTRVVSAVRREPITFAALGGLVVVAAVARFATLDGQSFDGDEMLTVSHLNMSFGGMLSTVAQPERTPPLYFVVAWVWIRLFGAGEVGLRSLSALAGTALVPVAFLAARELVSRRGALISAALVAVSPWLVWYSQEARAYALAALLVGLSFMFFAGLLRAPTKRGFCWWAVTSSLAIATHYFASFAVLPEAIWVLRSRRTSRRAAVVSVAAVATVMVALIPLALHQRAVTPTDVVIANGGSLGFRIADVAKQSLVGFDAPSEIALGIGAAALCAVAVALLLTRADARERRGAGVAAIISASVLVLAVGFAVAGLDYVVSRNMIVAWVPAAIVVGAGFGAMRGHGIGIAAATALAALFAAIVVAVAVDPRYQRTDWRGAAAALGRPIVNRALVIQPWLPQYRTYLPGIRRVPPRGGRVAEVDLVAIAGAVSAPGRVRHAPTAGAIRPPAMGFHEIERRHGDTFTVVRFRSPTPILLTRSALAASGLKRHRAAAVLYQRSPGPPLPAAQG